MAKAVQLHDAPICKGGLPEFPKFIVRTEAIQYGRGRSWKARWLCRCGREFEAMVTNVTRRHTTSCGCVQQERRHVSYPKHGHFVRGRPTGTYKSWQAMAARCTNPKHPAYKHYAGRNITICQQWMSFENFLVMAFYGNPKYKRENCILFRVPMKRSDLSADMGERPEGLTLDRINNDGNYEPGNCRWATMLEQNNNRRPPTRKKRA